MNSKSKNIIKKVIDIVLWIFLVVALAMTVLAFLAQADSSGIPKIGKTCMLTVASDSMNSTVPELKGFKKGDMIIGKALTVEEKVNLQVGDVITFYADLTPNNGIDDKELNTHRICEVIYSVNGNVDHYKTWGDNRTTNPVPDNYDVYPGAIQAKWTGKRIGGVGAAIGFLQSSTGFLICIVIPLLLFFLYELYVLIVTIMKIKNKDKRQITKEDEEMIKQRAIEEYLRQQAAAQANTATEAAPAENTNDSSADQNNGSAN